MTRKEKIDAFLFLLGNDARWCSGGWCACMGAVNCSYRHKWEASHPDEPHITKEEFDEWVAIHKPPKQEPLNITFRSK